MRQGVSHQEPRDRSSGRERRRLLVVDDEPAIRELLTLVLSREGYLIDVAVDGCEALRALQQKRYDGFIFDLKMPRLDGRELYRRLETMNRSLARRVIFVTGDTASLETRGFIAATGASLIEKPFDLTELQRQVLSVMGGALGDNPNG